MFHVRDIINLLAVHGYRVAEMADVRGTDKQGMIYEVTNATGDVAVMALTVTTSDVQYLPGDGGVPSKTPHPGTPASLYMAPPSQPRPSSDR